MDLIKIGQFIIDLRKEKNISQEELAKVLGISRQAVSRWETGNCLPDLDKVYVLCDYFNISFGEFLSGQRNKEYINSEYIKYITLNEKKYYWKKITTFIIVIFSLLIVISGIIFFFYNKYSVKFYKLLLANDNVSTNSSYLMETNDSFFLFINELNISGYDVYQNKIYVKNNDQILAYLNLDDNLSFSFKNMNVDLDKLSISFLYFENDIFKECKIPINLIKTNLNYISFENLNEKTVDDKKILNDYFLNNDGLLQRNVNENIYFIYNGYYLFLFYYEYTLYYNNSSYFLLKNDKVIKFDNDQKMLDLYLLEYAIFTGSN